MCYVGIYLTLVFLFFFFFFKQKTAYEMRISDWSSDVCSSDLDNAPQDSARIRADHPQKRRRHGNDDQSENKAVKSHDICPRTVKTRRTVHDRRAPLIKE